MQQHFSRLIMALVEFSFTMSLKDIALKLNPEYAPGITHYSVWYETCRTAVLGFLTPDHWFKMIVLKEVPGEKPRIEVKAGKLLFTETGMVLTQETEDLKSAHALRKFFAACPAP